MAILWWNGTSDEVVRLIWCFVILCFRHFSSELAIFSRSFEPDVLKAAVSAHPMGEAIGCHGCEFCHNVVVSAHCVANSRDEGTMLPLNILVGGGI